MLTVSGDLGFGLGIIYRSSVGTASGGPVLMQWPSLGHVRLSCSRESLVFI